MIKYLSSRLFFSIPNILVITLIVFLVIHLVPGDPAEIYLGEARSTPELLAQIRHRMGLDRPLHVQYISYMWDLFHGNLGSSLYTNQPVTNEILSRLPHTVELTISALGVAIILGLGLGILAAVMRNTWVDSLSMIIALVGISMPVFWMSLLLILFFSVHLRWLPAFGEGSLDRLVLPAIALALLSASTLARLVRSSMLDVLSQDYIRTAASKGLARSKVILRHGLKNAMIPIITIIGLQFGQLLTGAVLTETIFARRGLGRYYVEAILNKDFPVIQGLTLLIAVTYILINIIVDLAYLILDPRIRYE